MAAIDLRGRYDDSPPARAPAEEFEQVWEQHLPVVYGFVAHLVRDQHVAEDITAEAFEKAWRHWARYDPRRAKPSTWLCHIARNLAVDHLRRAGRAIPATDEELAALAPAAHDAELWEGLPPAMVAAVGRLSDVEREIVVLRVLLDFSLPEAAEVAGVSHSACGTYYSRALAKLRKALPVTEDVS